MLERSLIARLLPAAVLLALAACAGAGDTPRGGAAGGGDASERPPDTARRRPPKGAVTDTNFRARAESLGIRPPERRPPPPPLDRPLGVPPADSGSTKKADTTRGRE